MKGKIKQLIPKRLVTVWFALWVFMKMVAFCGIIILFFKKGFIQSVEKKEMGNMKTCAGVSCEMLDCNYWINREKGVDKVLLDEEKIKELNQHFLETDETGMYDLENMDVSEYEQSCYLICTRETDLRAYPTKEVIREDEADLNTDENQLSSIRLGEPMIGLSKSFNGEFIYVRTSNCAGWVAISDVGVCKGREEWLSMWKIPAKDCLVVTGRMAYLDDSNEAPQLSHVELSMGVTLRMVEEEKIPEVVQGRAACNGYVVYIPVRDLSGECNLQMGIIPANLDVSMGYLTFTKENVTRQIYKWLGSVYGWGGMLHSQDCSGLMRDVFACFGLELPRNTTGQSKMPVNRIDLEGKSDEEKEKIIGRLPMGTLLFMEGHVMMYLGEEQGDFYVISAAGTVMNEARREPMKLRCISVNSLTETYRPDNTSWMENLKEAVVLWE